MTGKVLAAVQKKKMQRIRADHAPRIRDILAAERIQRFQAKRKTTALPAPPAPLLRPCVRRRLTKKTRDIANVANATAARAATEGALQGGGFGEMVHAYNIQIPPHSSPQGTGDSHGGDRGGSASPRESECTDSGDALEHRRFAGVARAAPTEQAAPPGDAAGVTRVALSEQAAPPGDAEVVARAETPEPAAPGDATDCRDRLPLGARAAQCSAASARDPEARMHRFFAPTEQTTPEDLETCEQSLRSFAPDWQQFVWVYDITRAMLEWRHIEGVTFAPAQALVHKRLHDAWRAGKVPTQVFKHFISLTALRDYGGWWVDDDVMWTGNRCPGGHDCLLFTDRCNPTDLLNLANPERDPDGCPQWINMSVMRMETNSPIVGESLKTMWDILETARTTWASERQ